MLWINYGKNSIVCCELIRIEELVYGGFWILIGCGNIYIFPFALIQPCGVQLQFQIAVSSKNKKKKASFFLVLEFGDIQMNSSKKINPSACPFLFTFASISHNSGSSSHIISHKQFTILFFYLGGSWRKLSSHSRPM